MNFSVGEVERFGATGARYYMGGHERSMSDTQIPGQDSTPRGRWYGFHKGIDGVKATSDSAQSLIDRRNWTHREDAMQCYGEFLECIVTLMSMYWHRSRPFPTKKCQSLRFQNSMFNERNGYITIAWRWDPGLPKPCITDTHDDGKRDPRNKRLTTCTSLVRTTHSYTIILRQRYGRR